MYRSRPIRRRKKRHLSKKERLMIESVLSSRPNDFRKSSKKINEGFLEFVQGLFASILSLFGAEMDSATDASETRSVNTFNSRLESAISDGKVSAQDLGMPPDKKDQVKIRYVSPKTEKGKVFVKDMVTTSADEVLSDVVSKISQLDGVPAFPSQKSVNEKCRADAIWNILVEETGAVAKDAAATEAMAEEMEKFRPQVVSALEGVGTMKGFALSLKNLFPELEKVEDTAKPVTPGDVAQLAASVATVLDNSGLKGQSGQVIDFCTAYAQKNGFSLKPDSLSYLPSADRKGDVGKAAKKASEKSTGKEKVGEVDLQDIGVAVEPLDVEGVETEESDKSIFDPEFVPTEQGLSSAEGEITGGADEIKGKVSDANGMSEATMAGLSELGLDADSFEDAIKQIAENKKALEEIKKSQSALEDSMEDLSSGEGSIKDRLARTVGMFAVSTGTVGAFGAGAIAHLFGTGAAANIVVPSFIAAMPGVGSSASISGVGGAISHLVASGAGLQSTWTAGTLMGVSAGTWFLIGKILLAFLVAYALASGVIWAASKLLDKDEEWIATMKDKYFAYTTGLIAKGAKKLVGAFWKGIKVVWAKGIEAAKGILSWFKKKFAKNESIVYALSKPTRKDINALMEYHDMVVGVRSSCSMFKNHMSAFA